MEQAVAGGVDGEDADLLHLLAFLGEAGPCAVGGSQGAADQLVLPERLRLDWDAEAGTLTFSGLSDVNRPRLQQLFPDLYGEEPWTTATIPGTLTIAFEPAVIEAG